MLLTHQRRAPASRFSVCRFSRSLGRHSELQTRLSPNPQNLPSAVEHPTKDARRPERATRAEGPLFAKSSICHRSENRVHNSFLCHTFKFEHPTKDARPERATRAEGSLFAKSSICHTSEKFARNPCICHTSKFIRLKVLCLPHIRKTGGVGGLMLTSRPSGVPGPFLYHIISLLHNFISSGVSK